ncbi:MAG: hypothetical protein EXR75_03140 [Myxococcales bacterium]|nr:hypothetical protein [Myxococcales bacterium]
MSGDEASPESPDAAVARPPSGRKTWPIVIVGVGLIASFALLRSYAPRARVLDVVFARPEQVRELEVECRDADDELLHSLRAAYPTGAKRRASLALSVRNGTYRVRIAIKRADEPLETVEHQLVVDDGTKFAIPVP